MKVKKISITEAPPLQSFKMDPKQFNLIYGGNDHGKTLLLDVLTYLIFGFAESRINPSEVKGRVLVEENGKLKELTGEENIFEEHYGLSKEAINNIFRCRAGDLEIGKRERSNLWRFTQERLSDYSNINQIIGDAKTLTHHYPKMKGWAKQKQEERKKNKDIIKKIGKILKSTAYEDTKQYHRNERELEKLKRIEAKKIYESVVEGLKNLEEKRKEIEEKCGLIGDVERTTSQLAKFREKIRGLKDRIEELSNEIDEKKKEKEKLTRAREGGLRKERKYSEFDYLGLRDQVKETREIEERVEEKTILEKYRWLGPTSFVIGFLSITLGLIFAPPVAILGALLTIPSYGLVQEKRKRKQTRELNSWLRRFRIILSKFSNKKQKLTSTEDVQRSLDEINRKKGEAREAIQTNKTRLDELEKTKNDLKRDLEEKKRKRKDTIREQTGFLRENGCEKISELKEKIRTKKILGNEISSIKSGIISLLREKNEEKWEDKLKELKKKFVGDEEKKYPKLYKTKPDNLRKRIQSIEKAQDGLSKKVKQYEKEIYRQDVESLDELPEKMENARKELKDLEITFRAGEITIGILEEMLDSQSDFLSSIFTEGPNSISSRFKKFSNGLYAKTLLEGEDIRIQTRRGKILDASVLGSSATDALYLLIRTSLAAKIIGKKAFFFFDEPFAEMDPKDRRKEGVKTLKKLFNNGWQIFFFTFDDFVLKRVREEIPPDHLEIKRLPKLNL